MKNGMRHNFNISLPSYSLLKYVQVSPSITYGMNWYFSDIDKIYNQETKKVENIHSDLFGTFCISQNLRGGLSLVSS